MTPAHEESFRAWLEESEGLSRNTIRKVTTDLRTYRERGAAPEAELQRRRTLDYRYAWALWADYCDQHDVYNDLVEPSLERAPTHRRRRKNPEPKRLQEAVSIPIEQWRRFLAVLQRDPSPAARVIDVMCASALRVGDVLRTSRAELDRGFAREDGITRVRVKGDKDLVYSVRGGPEEEWQRLRALLAPRQLVCDRVSPASGGDWTANGAAYQACRRKLQRLAATAGIADRVHLHRLRRTVLVMTARITGNRWLTQQVAGHEDGSTTDTYLDEQHAIEVSQALAQVKRETR